MVLSEAVLFFNGSQIAKAMLYSEFEAILDGMAGVHDYAGEEVRAAYVAVDGQLWLRGCALFKLSFGSDGLADRHWNMPLRHLAEVAGPGPDLGGGRIRLACKSQCPVAWHNSQMWDPDMSTTSSHLVAIQRIIQANSLDLPVEKVSANDNAKDDREKTQKPEPEALQLTPPPASKKSLPPKLANITAITASQSLPSQAAVPTISAIVSEAKVSPEVTGISTDERVKLARTIKKQRFQIATLKSESDELIAKLKFQLLQKETETEKESTQLRGCLEVQQAKSDALKAQIKAQKAQIEAHELVAKDRLRVANEDKKLEVEALKAQFKEQDKLKVDEQIAQLNEQLQIKELELMYRDEISQQMEKELAQLRNQEVHLLDSGADQFLEKMQNLGLSFIAFHPGAGHVSIPLAAMNSYMGNPIRYIAEKCFVTEIQYKLWLSHYESPVCMHHTISGQQCTKRVPLTSLPSKFTEGSSDRCEEHKLHGQISDPAKLANV